MYILAQSAGFAVCNVSLASCTTSSHPFFTTGYGNHNKLLDVSFLSPKNLIFGSLGQRTVDFENGTGGTSCRSRVESAKATRTVNVNRWLDRCAGRSVGAMCVTGGATCVGRWVQWQWRHNVTLKRDIDHTLRPNVKLRGEVGRVGRGA